jgi:hypothetical protein
MLEGFAPDQKLDGAGRSREAIGANRELAGRRPYPPSAMPMRLRSSRYSSEML